MLRLIFIAIFVLVFNVYAAFAPDPVLTKYFWISGSKFSYKFGLFFKSAIKSNVSWLGHTVNLTL